MAVKRTNTVQRLRGKKVKVTTAIEISINNAIARRIVRTRQIELRIQEVFEKMERELLEKGKIFKPYSDWQFIEASLVYFKPKIMAIIKNQVYLKEVSFCDENDIYSDIWEKYYSNKEVLKPKAFFSRIKWLAKHSIEKELRRYRKYKCMSYQNEELGLINDIALTYTFNLSVEEKLDIANLFTDEIEKKVYKLILAGYKNREIYELMQYNCQRVIKRVKDAIGAYMMEYI